jgi:hypothetical protein
MEILIWHIFHQSTGDVTGGGSLYVHNDSKVQAMTEVGPFRSDSVKLRRSAIIYEFSGYGAAISFRWPFPAERPL